MGNYAQANSGHIGGVSGSYVCYVHVYGSTCKHTVVVCIITVRMMYIIQKSCSVLLMWLEVYKSQRKCF